MDVLDELGMIKGTVEVDLLGRDFLSERERARHEAERLTELAARRIASALGISCEEANGRMVVEDYSPADDGRMRGPVMRREIRVDGTPVWRIWWEPVSASRLRLRTCWLVE